MPHQPNKHFNSYKEGLDLEFLREYCMEHGERRVMERSEMLEETGELSGMTGEDWYLISTLLVSYTCPCVIKLR